MSADPIRLEVYRHRFESLCEEMGAALERSSFSANIKERRDYSCSLFDAAGKLVAQGDHMPVHLGSMPLSVEAALRGPRLAPGDVVLLNDPYHGGTHLPDITVVAPLWLRESPTPDFFVANRAHHSDVGGMAPGSMPMATEIYQEGLRIPPVRVVRGGSIEEELLELLLLNVRTPEERRGDLMAQLAAAHIGRRRLEEWVQRWGFEEVARYGQYLQAYSEERMREVVRSIPDGSYTWEDFLESDGLGRTDIRIAAAVEVNGGEVAVDFAGTEAQVLGPVNANRAITLSACAYALRCLSTRDLPFNQGCFEPLTVRAPEGSVVNARPPAAVCGGNVETSQRIVDVVLGALAPALPDRIPAASQGTMNNFTLGGVHPATGDAFTYYETVAGGAGGGPIAPGASGIHTHMTNTRNTPIEALEVAYPFRVESYRLRQGSGGIGAHRGGDGLVRSIRVGARASLTLLTERRIRAPWGLAGGAPGMPGRNLLLRDGTIEELSGKLQCELREGDVLHLETPGGGGWGEE